MTRAAEISHRVVQRLPGMNTEEDALLMLTDIEKDFEEVSALKQALHFGHQSADIKVYEAEIREYASKVFEKDINASSAFLQDAASQGVTIQQLCLKYPDFCDYLFACSDKAPALAGIQRH